jgi:hypothetical protein
MPDILTPSQVASALQAIGRELDGMPETIEALDEAEVRAQHAAKQAFRKAFMETPGAMDLRKVVADDAAADLQLTADLAGVQLRAARTQLSVLRDRLEVGRSVGTLVKLEYQTS